LLLGLAVFLLLVLPIYALTQQGLVRTIGQIVLTLVFLLVVGATGLFGYICIKAQARKWGAGLIAVALLALIGIYWIWAGHLPFLP
jgi:hypothetical protein